MDHPLITRTFQKRIVCPQLRQLLEAVVAFQLLYPFIRYQNKCEVKGGCLKVKSIQLFVRFENLRIRFFFLKKEIGVRHGKVYISNSFNIPISSQRKKARRKERDKDELTFTRFCKFEHLQLLL